MTLPAPLAARLLARFPGLSLEAAVLGALEAFLRPAPPTLAEAHALALARVKAMTPDEAFAHSVAVGIHWPEGGLRPEYGGTERGETLAEESKP